MTESEREIRKLKALESIASSLKSINFYLKELSDAKDKEIQILSATGSEIPPECPGNVLVLNLGGESEKSEY